MELDSKPRDAYLDKRISPSGFAYLSQLCPVFWCIDSDLGLLKPHDESLHFSRTCTTGQVCQIERKQQHAHANARTVDVETVPVSVRESLQPLLTVHGSVNQWCGKLWSRALISKVRARALVRCPDGCPNRCKLPDRCKLSRPRTSRMSSGNYIAEYAKSNRATCKKCRNTIGQGALRLGKMVRSPHFDGEIPLWHHFDCCFRIRDPPFINRQDQRLRPVEAFGSRADLEKAWNLRWCIGSRTRSF